MTENSTSKELPYKSAEEPTDSVNKIRVAEADIRRILSPDHDDFIQIRRQRRQAVYYSLTESEIDTYAQLGWLATFCLSFFGAACGLATGCIIAIIQSPPPILSSSPLYWITWLSAAFAAILLFFSAILLVMQHKQKRYWHEKESTRPTENMPI